MDIKETLFNALFPSLEREIITERLNHLLCEPTDFEQQMMDRYFSSQNLFFIIGHVNYKIDRNKFRLLWLGGKVISIAA